jgi:cation transport protein ChaC
MTEHDPSSPLKPFALTRDALQSDGLRRLLATVPDHEFWSDEQLDASLDGILAARPAIADGNNKDVWLFGYGSLIWNPAFHFTERQIGRVHGWHRRFCLWTSLGRGSPETPGLVLGLDVGGSCIGTAFRISADQARGELSLVWRREMLNGAYVPRWVTVDCAGAGRIQAITFTVNRHYPRYADRLDNERVARVLTNAQGYLGRCADYFFSTIHALEELGIHDSQLFQLYDRVIVLCAERARRQGEDPPAPCGCP